MCTRACQSRSRAAYGKIQVTECLHGEDTTVVYRLTTQMGRMGSAGQGMRGMKRVVFSGLLLGGSGLRAIAIIGTLVLAGTAMPASSSGATARSNAANAVVRPVAANGVGSPFELAFWQSVDGSSDPALYDAYLNRFPSGTFSEIARVKQQALRARAAPLATPAVVIAGPQPSAQSVQAQSVLVQPAVVPAAAPAPQVVPTSYVTAAPSAMATTPVAPGSPSALGRLLAELANSQGAGSQGAGSQGMANPGMANQAVGDLAPARTALMTAPAPRFAVPPPPTLVAVPPVVMPRTFCSADERNAFHDSVYVSSVNLARRNNEAAVAYMKQLQDLYDQHQLSHDPETMNLLAAAARDYQPVSQDTFGVQSMLVQMFNTLMAVPIVPCMQLSQASAPPMPGSAR